ncbi:MAG: c-type cytochrome biogenesis protein CcmI [Quisquiliibacterium sp.]
MIWFWLAIAALACAATAALVLPLLRSNRPNEDLSGSDEARRLAVYRDRRAEIESERRAGRLGDEEAARAQEELLDDAAVQFEAKTSEPGTARASRATLIAILAAAALPLASVFVYAVLGSPGIVALTPAELRGEISAESLEQTITELQKRVELAPQDGQAWAMLGRARRMAGDIPAARNALERAITLAPQDARTLADYAEILVMAAGGDFTGKPITLLEQALKLDPDDEKAVALMAAALYRRGDRVQALRYMRKLIANLPPASTEAQQLAEVIAKIESELSGDASSGQAAASRPAISPQASAPNEAATIAGQIIIDQALRNQAAPGMTLFVIARAVDGSRVPLAAQRLSVGAWPVDFSLGDQQAMNPQRLISQAAGVVIEARISRSGNAARSSGDLFGTSAQVAPGARQVMVRIDQRVP